MKKVKKMFRRAAAGCMAALMLLAGGYLDAFAADITTPVPVPSNGTVTVEETDNGSVELVNEEAEDGYPVGTQIVTVVCTKNGGSFVGDLGRKEEKVYMRKKLFLLFLLIIVIVFVVKINININFKFSFD